MAFSADNYKKAIIALLPPGKAWKVFLSSNFESFFKGLAEGPARIDQRADDLIEEVDPRTTTELITEWERLVGYPDDCILTTGTLAQRRNDVTRRLIENESLTIKYFNSIANFSGFEIAVEENHPFMMGIHSSMGDPIGDPDFQFVWDVFVESAGVAILECVFEQLKPAQTNVFVNGV